MPKHLEHLAKALSFCSENRLACQKAKDLAGEKYWNEIHRVLVYACRDIQEINFNTLKKKL